MVRLKARSGIDLVFEPPIISIPYGAIKRKSTYRGQEALATFQFLMVRLKAASKKHALAIIEYFNSLWCD